MIAPFLAGAAGVLFWLCRWKTRRHRAERGVSNG
jgi:hypothetical protein